MNLSNHFITPNTRQTSISQDSIIDSDDINIIEINHTTRNNDNIDSIVFRNNINDQTKHHNNTTKPTINIQVNDLLLTNPELFENSNNNYIFNPYSLPLSNINEMPYINYNNCHSCSLVILVIIFVLLFITIYRNS